jgi:hypothetical protein
MTDDDELKSLSPNQFENKHPLVTVIGGGITGLSAAHELIERGFRVQLVEQNIETKQRPSRKDHDLINAAYSSVGDYESTDRFSKQDTPEGPRERHVPRSQITPKMGGMAANQYGRVHDDRRLLHPYMYDSMRSYMHFDIETTETEVGLKVVLNNPDNPNKPPTDSAVQTKIQAYYKNPPKKPKVSSFLFDPLSIYLLRDRNSKQAKLEQEQEYDYPFLDFIHEHSLQPVSEIYAFPWTFRFSKDDPTPQLEDIDLPDLNLVYKQIKKAYQQYRDDLEELFKVNFGEHDYFKHWESFTQGPTFAKEVLQIEIIGVVSCDEHDIKSLQKGFVAAIKVMDQLLECRTEDHQANIPNLNEHFIVKADTSPRRAFQFDSTFTHAANRVEFRVLQRQVPGEHGFRFFPNFYFHLFDTMKRTPLLQKGRQQSHRTTYDHLVEVEHIDVASKHAETFTFKREIPTSISGLKNQFEALQALGADTHDIVKTGLRVLKYMTSSSTRREREYEDITWWDFVGDVSNYNETVAATFMHMARAASAMRPSEVDARSFGNAFLQMAIGWVDKNRPNDMILNGPTSEAWIDHWKRYLETQGVEFIPGKVTQLIEDDSGKELTPIFGVKYDKDVKRALESHLKQYLNKDGLLELSLLELGYSLTGFWAVWPVKHKWISSSFETDVKSLLLPRTFHRLIAPELGPGEIPKEYKEEHTEHLKKIRELVNEKTITAAVESLMPMILEQDKLPLPTTYINNPDFYILAISVEEAAQLVNDYVKTKVESEFESFKSKFDREFGDEKEKLPSELESVYREHLYQKNLDQYLAEKDKPYENILDGDFLKLYHWDKHASLAGFTKLEDRDDYGRPRNPEVHPYREMVGVQYFYEQKFQIGEYHVYYLDSPWGLTSISQPSYWQQRHNSAHSYLGQTTVDIGGMYTPGTIRTDKTGWNCTAIEIAEEAYGQMASNLNQDFHYNIKFGWEGAPTPSYFHLDKSIKFDEDGNAIENQMPFLLNLPGQWKMRPGLKESRLDVPKLREVDYSVSKKRWILAGTYMATHTRMTTMEAANESARHAVNALLQSLREANPRIDHPDRGGFRQAGRTMGSSCQIFPLETREIPDMDFFKDIDHALVRRGLPHFLDILKVIEFVDDHKEPFISLTDGLAATENYISNRSLDFYTNQAKGGSVKTVNDLAQLYLTTLEQNGLVSADMRTLLSDATGLSPTSLVTKFTAMVGQLMSEKKPG